MGLELLYILGDPLLNTAAEGDKKDRLNEIIIKILLDGLGVD